MASKGVERIEMSEGDAFDPNTQEAMSVLPCTQPEHSPGTIAAKWQVRLDNGHTMSKALLSEHVGN